MIPADPLEGLNRNPVDHPDGRHESCEACNRWFPEAEIEFNQGKYRCGKCRRRLLRIIHARPAMMHDGIIVEGICDEEKEDAA